MMIDEHGDCFDLRNVSLQELSVMYRALRDLSMRDRLTDCLRDEIGFFIEMALEKKIRKFSG